MATFRQIVYTVLDEIKSVNGDSYITEEHVIFLANQYRLFLLQQRINKEGASSLSSSMQQTICLDLEKIETIPDFPCIGDTYLKSVQKIPTAVKGTIPVVFPYDYFNTKIQYITKDRMKYVGYNKYLKNIIYCCKMDDYLYLKSSNPQFLYMKKVKMQGIFEDAEAASSLACDKDTEECVDTLDKEFPLSGDMIPQMVELLVKELYNALNRPTDEANNANDDIADLVAYIRRNMKSDLAKQITT